MKMKTIAMAAFAAVAALGGEISFDAKEEPIIPFAAITGRPSKERLTRILESYSKVGVTQYMIYARTGLEIEYLSDEWFGMCEHICAEAKRLGFTSVWLYDEFNWPSGTCCKRIMKENPKDGLTQLTVNKDFKFEFRNSKVVSDLLSPKVAEKFLDLVHRRYEARIGKYFGSLVKGIFTDEPDVGWFEGRSDDRATVAWYPELEDEYAKACGGNLRDDMMSAARTGVKVYEPVCRRLIAKRYKETFVDRVVAWAGKYGMVLTGHLMDEYHTDGAQTRNGHILEVLSAFSFPGIDDIFTFDTMEEQEWITLGTGQYAIERRGNKGGLAELFALGQPDLTVKEMLRQFYLVSCFGVTRYACMAQIDAKGSILKNLYYSTVSPTQGWFVKYPEILEEATRAAEFGLKEKECRIAVRYPYETTHIPELLHQLTKKQYQWKLVMPGESTDADVVLAVKNGMLVNERTNDPYIFNIGAYESAVLSKLDLRSAVVETPDGRLVEDVFVRIFKNGEVVVLDYSGKTRDLVMRRKGVKSAFRLYAKGVKVFPGWRVEPEKPNTLRADFVDGVFEFGVKEKVCGVKVMVRNYGPNVKLTLDGREVKGVAETKDLPDGYDNLYLASTPVDLDVGIHRLVWEDKGETLEAPYLPEAILVGVFASNLGAEYEQFVGHGAAKKIERRHVPWIGRYAGDGVGLWGYAGALPQEAEVVVPHDALTVGFDTGDVVSELFIDGKSMGARVVDPFRWVIPENVRGKRVTMKLVRYFSCGRIYGNTVFKRVWEEKGRRRDMRRWLPDNKPRNDEPPTPFCEPVF